MILSFIAGEAHVTDVKLQELHKSITASVTSGLDSSTAWGSSFMSCFKFIVLKEI